VKPLDKVDQTPSNDAMDRRDRTALDCFNKCPALSIIEPRPLTGRLAIKQAIGTSRIEPNHPVTHDLQANSSDPRGCSPASAVVNLCQCQKPTSLVRVLRRTRQPSQSRSVEILPQANC
jgi:hypothetical protein